MAPKLSIIIPCYNSANTLEDTLISIIEQDFLDWEAIIVNDDSKDNVEEIALKWVDKDNRFKYFKKENGGLASARNFAIKQAKGIYILPLDSDNKIRKSFAKNAIKIFKENENVGVVYGDVMYFGEKEGIWKVGEFDKYKLLKHNYIDACAIIRKEIYDIVGLYDENLPYQGHEDWDFWIRVIDNSLQFYYLEEITFDYRVHSRSMIKSFDAKMLKANIHYIEQKHYKVYVIAFRKLYKYLGEIKDKKQKQKKKNILIKLKHKLYRIKVNLFKKRT